MEKLQIHFIYRSRLGKQEVVLMLPISYQPKDHPEHTLEKCRLRICLQPNQFINFLFEVRNACSIRGLQ